ncbi:LemA family protein [Pedobacter sp. P351]|uniref:LemA family protein n=1 Tax=Pedobacter superstes TaxID=3133441 RepID=UPI0030AA6479
MIIPAIIAAVVLLFGVILYNTLIAKKNQVTNAFSAIDVMLKKRFDLLPNLVELVRQYMQHESAVLNNLTSLRTQAYSPDMATNQKMTLDADVTKGIRSVMLNAENYPDLKANTNFINLQTTWTESEEQIAAARRTFNASVTDYNNAIMMFPGSIVAGILNYQPL